MPMLRAVAQLDDPVFLGVLVRSVAWAALAFAALLAGSFWWLHRLLAGAGWWSWAAGVAGGIGAAVLAVLLFLPVAAIIGTFYVERIARAVERRFYPDLPPVRGTPFVAQCVDALVVGGRVLILSLLSLLLTLVLPGIGVVLGWAISGYAIGRGLFGAVALRRVDRTEALYLHRRRRPVILVQGGLLALAAFVPLLNLLIPVLGTAAMVHVLNQQPAAGARSHAWPKGRITGG